MNQPPWMAVAWADLGIAERPGSGHNQRVVAYFHRVGYPGIRDDETAWCAAFVGACLENANLRSTRSLAARSYLAWGVAADEPQLGAITVLSRGSDPALGHVGFLVGLTGTAVYLLGGNQSNAVTVQSFARSQVLGFRLPSAADVSARQDTPVADRPTQSPDFDAALSHVLEFEGGWSDDPFDPGGATNKGITIGVFARERNVELTAETIAQLKFDLQRISDDDVRRIYLERYWHAASCPALPPSLASFHFDAAVNQGVTGAARMLQEALSVEIDGEIGSITLAAAHRAAPADVLARYAEIRRRRYRSLGHFWRFGRGWLRRVDAALARALMLAQSAGTAPQPNFPPLRQTETTMPDTPKPFDSAPATEASPTKWWGESLTIWGALLTAVSTVAPAVFAAMGIDLPADLIQRLGRDSMTAIQAITGLVGTVMTILGRIRASTAIGRRVLNIRI